VVFVADDLGAWLVGLLADATRKKLTALMLGSDQERALRKAATAAVQDIAAEMSPSVAQAGQLAMVISEVFREPMPDAPLAGPATLLEGLQAGIARQLAVLDDAGLTGTGRSSADVLGVPGAVLAEKLTDHLIREIMLRGSGGGPLTPLADQLNHDLTHRMLARLAGEDRAGSAIAVRVGEADPRRLGVHAAISVPGVPDEVLPQYVARDVDAAEFGVRATVAAAAGRGGFVLLIGGSSVGKTRCAFEAVTALLPEWWLVHPAGTGEVAALAGAPAPRTVVWLDELQRYLDGEPGLAGGVIRMLLNAPDPVVIIGTLWPEFYAAYTALPGPGTADLHAREREVLGLADVVRIGPEFSLAEQRRALAAAERDPRLQAALNTAGYGLTQTLAAAPQLVARWRDAQTANPYAWAVLTAALDVARLGARAPLSVDFLRAAVPGYCTSQQQAEAPDNWFEQALAYATGKLHGAAAALRPAGTGMSHIAGYTAADYLIQHTSRERRYARMPASIWDAVLGHVRDPADITRLAHSARRRLLYRYAIQLYQHAAAAGNEDAARQLAVMLADRGDLDELRARAHAGDGTAALQLAVMLAESGDLDEAEQMLRIAADAVHRENWHAALRLANLLAKRGDLDGLRALAHAGNEFAPLRLAELLADRGDLDQAEQILRAWADAGNGPAARQLAELLADRGDLDQAEQILRAAADAGDEEAATMLAELLADRGDLAQAEQILRAPADAGHEVAATMLARLLDERGDLDGLRGRADAGDATAGWKLIDLLTRLGRSHEAEQALRAMADAGSASADRQLAVMLAERGDLDGLRVLADASGGWAARKLAELLAGRGDLDGLRGRTDAGDGFAARQLAELLAERGDLDEATQILRARAQAGDGFAARQLAELLAERGNLNEAEQILRARVQAGDAEAARQLPGLLAKQGRSEQAEQLRRFGLNLDGSIARG
jgi:predicted negative regulator of RcsB-dependent stress response